MTSLCEVVEGASKRILCETDLDDNLKVTYLVIVQHLDCVLGIFFTRKHHESIAPEDKVFNATFELERI